MDTQQTQDQAHFWKLFLKGIAGNIVSGEVKNIISIDSDIICEFDQDLEVAMAQAYQIGNSIPPWSLTWDGAPRKDLFKVYQSFIEDISPEPSADATADMKKSLDDIGKKINSLSSQTQSLLKKSVSTYLETYCMSANKNGYTCDVLMPDSPTLKDYLKQYKDSQDYKQKIKYLELEFSGNLKGMQSQFDRIAEKYYGSNYKQIREAKDAVNLADPMELNGFSDANQNTSLMNILENGTSRFTPRFTVSNLDEFKTWLGKTKVAKAMKTPPAVEINFNNKINTSHEIDTHSSYSESNFFFCTHHSNGTQKIDMTGYTFDFSATFQDVIQVTLTPSNQWFFENMIEEYKDYYKERPNSPLSKQDLWGANGIFNSYITGVIVGYGGHLKFNSSFWSSSDFKTQRSTSDSIGIGWFKFDDRDSSKSTSDHKHTETKDGVEIHDASEMPKILAVITRTPNV
ncbi:MAG: hypothetical protein PSN36_01915 [Gammaproteobacteria bacterium]|nr:hypothetical protein [Gammaproteobacteria bacterium]